MNRRGFFGRLATLFAAAFVAPRPLATGIETLPPNPREWLREIYADWFKEHGRHPRVLIVSPAMFTEVERGMLKNERFIETSREDRCGDRSLAFRAARLSQDRKFVGQEYAIGG